MTNQGGIMLFIQIILVILYASVTVYSPNQTVILRTDYSLFQDIHVMVFIGFGFLMVFLKKYGYSAVGFNFLLASLVLQWSILFKGLFDMNDNYKIEIGLRSLYNADVSAATVLISMGALLGRTTHLQLLILGLLEVIAFCLNNELNKWYFKAVDVGGSIAIHTFGAYFGLAASYSSLRHSPTFIKESTPDSSYMSNILAMIGTIFLWVYWPSFNSIDLEDERAHRAIVNTYLALASSCVTSFAASQLASDQNKLDMVHIQNSTLAGGVAIGACAHLLVYPYGAILLGMLAGCLSVYGYALMTGVLENKLKVLDTCGVHNLHGMPGILGGLAVIIVVSSVKPDSNRSPQEQAGYQALFLVVTILNALVSGIISGLVIRWKIWGEITSDNFYNDQALWKLPEDDGEDSNIVMVQSVKWKQMGILNGKMMFNK